MCRVNVRCLGKETVLTAITESVRFHSPQIPASRALPMWLTRTGVGLNDNVVAPLQASLWLTDGQATASTKARQYARAQDRHRGPSGGDPLEQPAAGRGQATSFQDRQLADEGQRQ